MKKRLLSIIALIISVMMILSVFSGCDLVVTDNEKDMAQIVATVKTSDEPDARVDKIKKSQMVTYYINYGYYYVNQQGLSVKEAFNLILENIINGKIMLQAAIKYYQDPSRYGNLGWEAVSYLEEDEQKEAEYTTRKSMDSLIDRYVEDETEKQYETFSGDVRTVPTDAAKNSEPTDTQIENYLAATDVKGATVNEPGSKRYKAYNKVLKYLKLNKILGDNVNSLKDSVYYKDTLKSNQESMLIEKYENDVKKTARQNVTFNVLSGQYTDMYNAQVNGAGSAKEFEDALSGASTASPIVYTPYNGYVYVYNLLLGANDYQTALIKKLDSKDADYYDDVRNILLGTSIKDLRSSWLLSSYDFDMDTSKFTGDYAFLDESLPFKGTVELVNTDKKDDEDAIYRITSLNEYTIDSFTNIGENNFIKLMDEYIYGSVQNNVVAGLDLDTEQSKYICRVVNTDAANGDYEKRINELLFAFSTDPGSLNTYKGYLITPKPELGGSETFVKEFANAGRLFMEKNLKDKSYVIVATQYGYHVMFFSQLFNVDVQYDSLIKYLNYVTATDENTGTADYWQGEIETMIGDWENADKNSYLYKIIDTVSKASANLEITEALSISKYISDSRYVVRYQSTYQDLLDM